MFDQTYPFSLLPLPYSYDSLEPYIDKETMYYHHDKHLKTYVDNLNKALENNPKLQNLTLEQLLTSLDNIPEPLRTTIRNNAGGVYNHNLYFYSLKPETKDYRNEKNNPFVVAYPGRAMTLPVLSAIVDGYGSFYHFKDLLKDAALQQFGSGYAWLVLTPALELAIIKTNNQDTPLTLGLIPLLPIDVWEHAYYLLHRNDRAAYLENLFHVIHWDAVNHRYLTAMME